MGHKAEGAPKAVQPVVQPGATAAAPIVHPAAPIVQSAAPITRAAAPVVQPIASPAAPIVGTLPRTRDGDRNRRSKREVKEGYRRSEVRSRSPVATARLPAYTLGTGGKYKWEHSLRSGTLNREKVDFQGQVQVERGLEAMKRQLQEIVGHVGVFLGRRRDDKWSLTSTIKEMDNVRVHLTRGRDEFGEAVNAFAGYVRHLSGEWPPKSDKVLLDRLHYESLLRRCSS